MNISQLTQKERAKLAENAMQNAVMLGDWKEVQDIPTEELKKYSNEPDKLKGLIFKGYEMKWGEVNTNGELYDEGAFDEFIEDYFVKRGFNMPVTIEHSYDPQWLCGRVLYIERNSVGFYFVVYVPETYPEYDRLRWMVQEGLIQGLSKEGYYQDYEWKMQDPNDYDSYYIHVHKLAMSRISLVCTPANRVRFENVRETKNAVVFQKPESTIARLFKKKEE